MPSKISKRLENIDYLRGIAIIFVVSYHYISHYSTQYLFFTDNWFGPFVEYANYGWSGVDIFFIVSGYCIAMTIIKTNNLIEFFVRRFARIYPAYVFCGIVTLVFYFFFDLPGREVDMFTGLMNLIFANFIPGLSFTYIDGIYWALIVELKFYIFFGILYFLLRDLNKSIIAWAVFSIILNIILLIDKSFLYFFTSVSPHANLFLIGLFLFNLQDKKILNYLPVIIIGIINIFVNERYFGNEIYFICLILITSLILNSKYSLNIRILSKIGLISFSWYLIHNAVGIILIREINKLGFMNLSVFFAVFFTLLISIISFYLIEQPLKKKIIQKYQSYL